VIKMRPMAICQALFAMCGWVVEAKTYREAKKLGLRHVRETGHIVRVEQINTELLGLDSEESTGPSIPSSAPMQAQNVLDLPRIHCGWSTECLMPSGPIESFICRLREP
jgi:hypothetical protein